mmetsp:Transcript_34114/g.79922  ORF Transcript_34114/g.79922 Transcript_34114/m.79922 type:complete len:111 (-) Transcript_34114:345-677(-)
MVVIDGVAIARLQCRWTSPLQVRQGAWQRATPSLADAFGERGRLAISTGQRLEERSRFLGAALRVGDFWSGAALWAIREKRRRAALVRESSYMCAAKREACRGICWTDCL